MARTLFIVVGDDFALLQKARAWGQENGVTVATYSVGQWDEGLETHSFRSQLHIDPVALNSGSSPLSEGGKILQFPTPQSSSLSRDESKRVHTMEEMESQAIRQAIMEYRGNLTEAAKALGIGRATLYRKVKQYNIDPSFARNRGPKAA